MGGSLDADIAYFNAHIDDLRRQSAEARKDIVLIHARTVIGFYSSVAEATSEGYQKFGSDLFLARSVSAGDKTLTLASIFTQ